MNKLVKMNNCIVTGFIQKKTEYCKNENGIMEFRFFLNNFSTIDNKMYSIPIKVRGELADRCYANIKTGFYVEVQGEIVRPKVQQVYIVADKLSFRAPKGNNTVHIRTTEILEIFDVSKVMERMKPKGNKNEGTE